METPIQVLVEVTSALEEAGIEYVVVGSLASSMHGMYRATADVDIVVNLNLTQLKPLVKNLEDRFYVDEKVATEAVARRHSFNLIHFDSVFKVDIFVPKPGDFGWQQLEHRQLTALTENEEPRAYISSPEDMIVAKLLWYRAGNETSTVQWKDTMGILAARRLSIDLNYLNEWANRFHVGDLLKRALDESQ
jgi:hypothetical protein